MRVALLAAFPLHVIPGFQHERPAGHYATWLPQLSERFADASDCEFHWLISSREPVPDEPVRWKNQFFHLLHNPQRLRVLRGYRQDCRLMRERLDHIAPDFVHAWGTEDCYSLAGAGSGRPWLLSMQGILTEYVRRAPMHPLVHLQAMYERYVFRRARELTVESHWGEGVLQRLVPHARIRLVEYGVQPLFFGKTWSPDERPNVVFIGTPDARKGIEDAVRAFGSRALAHAELRILGDRDSPLSRRLQAISGANVRWIGRVSTEETADYLSRSWCLVLPTRADTSPNVVKEARVIGLPVITTPHGGQSDYIEDGVNGFLVEPGAIELLTDRLSSLLSNLKLARAMGARKHAEQREHFRPERTAELFLRLYRELAAGR